ncbi:hypothetical protein [Pseudomonas matsuisoli]|uniref:Uncharacterized protein n=1 Tax=Pseudomonas matsuisoli TaxID=1515666 RepID=A0A917PXV2_9PSED|nr:hypothetical protein [Pseudomonas matsuisoli]GGJ98193.1 hypothetical protein GCM10009304_25160 [Pseudomonas matsuisoli]
MRTLQELCEAIQSHETLEGVVTACYAPTDSPRKIGSLKEIDDFLLSCGYTSLGVKWIPLNRSEAIKHLQEMLNISLAYGTEMLSKEESERLAQEFSNFFSSENSVWFTNGNRYGWNPVTKSTFENATVVLDETNIALVLFEDED